MTWRSSQLIMTYAESGKSAKKVPGPGPVSIQTKLATPASGIDIALSSSHRHCPPPEADTLLCIAYPPLVHGRGRHAAPPLSDMVDKNAIEIPYLLELWRQLGIAVRTAKTYCCLCQRAL